MKTLQGRPSVINEKGPSVIENLRKGMGMVEACHSADVSYQTVRNWIKRGEAGEKEFKKFATAMTRAKRNPVTPKDQPTGAEIEFSFMGNTIRLDCADQFMNIGAIKGEDGAIKGIALIPGDFPDRMNVDSSVLEDVLAKAARV